MNMMIIDQCTCRRTCANIQNYFNTINAKTD